MNETCRTCKSEILSMDQGGPLCGSCWEVQKRLEDMDPLVVARLLQMSGHKFIAIQLAYTSVYLEEDL